MAYPPTVIPPHTTVDGAIETPGDLTVEGRVEGEVRIGGTLTIAPAATCVAYVEARSLRVHGELLGNAVCTDSIHVEAGGRVVGDIRAPSVDVDAGADVDGRVDLLPPEPRGATIQRLPLSARTPMRRPTLPPLPASHAPDDPQSRDFFDEQPTQDARGPSTRERVEQTAPTLDERPLPNRTVPKPPRPSGRVRVASRNRS